MSWRTRLGLWLLGVTPTTVSETGDVAPTGQASPEAHTAMDTLVMKYGGTYDRVPSDSGIKMRLHLPDGTTLVGNGSTTAAAVSDLWKKAEAYQ